MDTKVLEYINKKETWSKELTLLRNTLLSISLEETLKWGAPTYTFNAKKYCWISSF